MIVHHICIQTANYKKSLDFYINILGFELVKESPNFHTRKFNSWLKLGDFMIELQTPKKYAVFLKYSPINEGPVHIGFSVENVEKFYNTIVEKGYSNFKQKNGKNIYKVEKGYLFKIIAPEGTQIEIRDMSEI